MGKWQKLRQGGWPVGFEVQAKSSMEQGGRKRTSVLLLRFHQLVLRMGWKREKDLMKQKQKVIAPV